MARRWTVEEDNYLMGRYTIQPIETTASKLSRSIIAVKKRAGYLGLSKYHDNVYISAIAKCFHLQVSVIHRWMEQLNMPHYREKAGEGYRYRVDVEKFWEWANTHKEDIDWRSYELRSLVPEPGWVRQEVNITKGNNNRKNITQYEKDKIKLLIAKGVLYKDIAFMLGRTTNSIKHIANRM